MVPRVRTRAWLAVAVLAALAGALAIATRVRSAAPRDPAAPAAATEAPAPAGGGRAIAPALPAPARAVDPAGASAAAVDPPGVSPEEAAASYPVDLEALRARLPDNRYWELGAPTSDPEVARARAERARAANALFGRTQTGEATRQEIRAYYAEQRRISQDYLKLSLLVLAERGSELPQRDRGMFELSVQLHTARLKQIDRDLADALARRGDRP
jgi:hypothetical protein